MEGDFIRVKRHPAVAAGGNPSMLCWDLPTLLQIQRPRHDLPLNFQRIAKVEYRGGWIRYVKLSRLIYTPKHLIITATPLHYLQVVVFKIMALHHSHPKPLSHFLMHFRLGYLYPLQNWLIWVSFMTEMHQISRSSRALAAFLFYI